MTIRIVSPILKGERETELVHLQKCKESLKLIEHTHALWEPWVYSHHQANAKDGACFDTLSPDVFSEEQHSYTLYISLIVFNEKCLSCCLKIM